MTGEQAYADVF